jgi:hypothetical protein
VAALSSLFKTNQLTPATLLATSSESLGGWIEPVPARSAAAPL